MKSLLLMLSRWDLWVFNILHVTWWRSSLVPYSWCLLPCISTVQSSCPKHEKICNFKEVNDFRSLFVVLSFLLSTLRLLYILHNIVNLPVTITMLEVILGFRVLGFRVQGLGFRSYNGHKSQLRRSVSHLLPISQKWKILFKKFSIHQIKSQHFFNRFQSF